MGLIKNEHGVYHVRRKVPKLLEAATARVLGVAKERVSWLKETLGTKDERRAKVLAKPIMMKFDRVLAQAEALLIEQPVRAVAVIKAEVRALQDVIARNRGEPIDSPPLPDPGGLAPISSRSLRAAYDGWNKIEVRKKSSQLEFSRGIDRFIELHGNLDVALINRRHVREFRPLLRRGHCLAKKLVPLLEPAWNHGLLRRHRCGARTNRLQNSLDRHEATGDKIIVGVPTGTRFYEATSMVAVVAF
jgi:hypothetical protein